MFFLGVKVGHNVTQRRYRNPKQRHYVQLADRDNDRQWNYRHIFDADKRQNIERKTDYRDVQRSAENLFGVELQGFACFVENKQQSQYKQSV